MHWLALMAFLLQTASPVYITTYIDVQPTATSQGATLVRQYRQASRADSGNIAADAFQEISRPSRFVVIEVWKDQASFEAHEKAAPTGQFRERLKAIHHSPYDQRVSHGFAIDPAPQAAADDALFTVTHVDVPPPSREQTEAAVKRVAEESRKQSGHVRYDVFQQNDPRTNHFTVFAAWKSNKEFDTNGANPATVQFRETMGPMLGALYDERLYKALK